MPIESKPSRKKSSTALQRHATWVREHPRIEPTPFPSYPDEVRRRGASRGALPNGNPWRSELTETTQPGRRGSLGEKTADASRPSPLARARPRVVHAPPNEPLPVGVVAPRLRGASKRIASDVAALLSSSKILEGERVEIDVDEGAVILRGRLPTTAARREAEMIASSVRGVTEVDNRIRIGRR